MGRKNIFVLIGQTDLAVCPKETTKMAVALFLTAPPREPNGLDSLTLWHVRCTSGHWRKYAAIQKGALSDQFRRKFSARSRHRVRNRARTEIGPCPAARC